MNPFEIADQIFAAIGFGVIVMFACMVLGKLICLIPRRMISSVDTPPKASPMEHQPTSRSHQAARAVDTAPRGGSAWSAGPTETELARHASNRISANAVSL